MSDWQPEHDVELTEMYAGMCGESYAKALVTDSMLRLGERVVARYVEGKSLDEALTAIENIEPETAPEAPKHQGIGSPEYKATLEALFRRQFHGEELQHLLKQLEA